MINKNKINLAIQVLPVTNKIDTKIVADAIECIQNSGLKYEVSPLETVIEGYYDEVMEVVKKVQEVCFEKGANKMLVYIKIQHNTLNDVSIEGKMENYR